MRTAARHTPQELKKPCTARDSQECLLEETVKKVAVVLGPHQAKEFLGITSHHW